jgi:hypothetical protein
VALERRVLGMTEGVCYTGMLISAVGAQAARRSGERCNTAGWMLTNLVCLVMVVVSMVRG